MVRQQKERPFIAQADRIGVEVSASSLTALGFDLGEITQQLFRQLPQPKLIGEMGGYRGNDF